jgi:acylphosphatase
MSGGSAEDPRTVVRRRLVVRGSVQGVGYRWTCASEAERLRVHGWVRNRSDGTVELVAEGAPGAVDALVAWAHRGPPHASVTDVEITDEAPEGLVGFRVAHG